MADHQLQRFKFKNQEGQAVNDLSVEFDKDGVRTRDPGPFDKAVIKGKRAKLENGDVKTDEVVQITFERDGEFNILHWQWTKDGNPVGNEKVGYGGV